MGKALDYRKSLRGLVSRTIDRKPVYQFYRQLVSNLQQGLGEEYAQLFSEPYISQQALSLEQPATWTSQVISSKATPLLELPERDRSRCLSALQSITEKIEEFASQLDASTKASENTLARIVREAVHVPDESCILIEEGKIVFVAWGFDIKGEPSFNLRGIKLPKKQEPPQSEPEEGQDQEEENLLPKEPRVLAPIAEEDIIEDEDSGRRIVGNRLNLALLGEDLDIQEFARAFKRVFPQKEYRIIYYDDQTYRFQVTFPVEERQIFIESIKQKLEEFDLLVFPESLLSNLENNSPKNHTPTNSSTTWHHDLVKSKPFWQQASKGSSSITVAVIDDGFDLKHPCFKGRTIKAFNTHVRGATITPASGHGTHVAGLAIGNEVNGVSGIAPECEFMPIQVADTNGLMPSTAIIDGVLYAIQNRVSVINMSLGESISKRYTNMSLQEQQQYAQQLFKDEERFWHDLFKSAAQQEIVVVLAAGNDDALIGMDPRARNEYAIKVSAVDPQREKAPFSNHGKLSTISAPGLQVYSSYPHGKYTHLDGTSMAAPIVAGAVALLKSQRHDITYSETVSLLQRTAIDPVTIPEKPIGKILQLDRALADLNGSFQPPKQSTQPPPPPPTPKPKEPDKARIEGSPRREEVGVNKPGCLGWFGNLWPFGGSQGGSGCSWGCLQWLLYLLLLLLLLWLLFFLLRSCESPSSPLPPEPGYIPPVDSTKIEPSPDSVRTIISDRLNIAFKGEAPQVIEKFAKDFKEQFPDDAYRVIYYDNRVKRVQIEIPSDQRVHLKQTLKSTFPDYDMLIWEESLFQHNGRPDDPMMQRTDQSWYLEAIKAYDAWDVTMGDSNVVVAVIDNGFDLRHPELQGKIYKPYNPFTKKGNVEHNRPDVEGASHGTHTAGTAVAIANNGIGISGIAPKCKLMPIKVADERGIIPSSAIIDGVLFAVHQGADVINISLGMHADPRLAALPIPVQQSIADTLLLEEAQFWNELIEIAYDKNVVVVMAAGNEDIVTRIDPMKRSKKAIIVSAVDPNLRRASFSNFGENSTISAPGVQIYSTVPNNGYEFQQGTSMASPVVAGGVALIKSVNPVMPVEEIIKVLQRTGKPIASGEKRIGRLIQLSSMVNEAFDRRKEQPRVDCPEVQAQIDSLLLEIDRLQRQCQTPEDTLKIPEQLKDLTLGNWKSNSDLFNTSTGEPVTLYLQIQDEGRGALFLVQQDGIQCQASASLSLSGGQLDISQQGDFNCEDGSSYPPYDFSCQADENGTAVCHAQNQKQDDNRFTFQLIKVTDSKALNNPYK